MQGSKESLMPIYEYHCQACGQDTEVLQKISDAPKTDCPQCGQSSLVKKVSAAGFQLKGSGWYATDFKGGSDSTTASTSGGHDHSGGACASCPAAKPAANA
jgi:putative FmdB family regulatory protein